MKQSHGLGSDLIHFLERRESYPHNPERVQHIQTHISHVFMVPPYVYKIKKPVNFDFLDYSTLEKRQYFCHQEVELNRRLCEGVYLGVVAIIKEGDRYYFAEEGEKPEAVAEYTVKMKQLSEAYFLYTYIKEGTLTSEHLDRVANKLASFYNRQESDKEILKWGRINNIRVNTDENFRQTKEFIADTIDRNTFEAIKYFTDYYFDKNKELFGRRIDENRIVDGHGDLHLEHIHISPEQVRIYDCIEFNDRFRYGDLAADLAYLAMDLDFNNCWWEDRYFIDRMAEKLDDQDLWKIIDFYKCYRAYVKGKVKSLQSREPEVNSEDRKQAGELAKRYFNQSLRYALIGSHPFVIIFMGRVGTGKSTLAKHLAEKLNVKYFSSDYIRKKIAKVPFTKRVSVEERAKLYSPAMSENTYGKLREEAINTVENGESVILDATFSHKKGRHKLVRALLSKKIAHCFIEVQASDKVIKERLKSRPKQENVISDARLEDFDKLNEKYNPPGELTEGRLISINSEQPVEKTIRQLYESLAKRNVSPQTNRRI